MVAILVAVLFSQMFLAGFDIGPVSLRVYILCFLLLLVLGNAAISGRRIFETRESFLLFSSYMLLILWTVISRFWNSEPLGRIAYSTASTHFYSLSAFIAVQYVLRSRRDIMLVAGLMALTAVLSGVVGILQWLGAPWAWTVTLALNPGEKSAHLVLGTLLGQWGFVPGLSLYSIPFSYHLISFGVLSYAWVRLKKGGRRAFWVTALMILLSAVLLAQSRSAIFSLLAAVVFSVWCEKRYMGGPYERRPGYIRLFLLMVLVLGLAFVFFNRLSTDEVSSGEGRYPLYRTFRIADPERLDLAQAALGFGSQHLLAGGGAREFGAQVADMDLPNLPDMSQAPHNMFLNALAFYGLPGVALLMVLLFRTYRVSMRALIVSMHDRQLRWLSMGAVMGVLAYIINGQFHNDSFVTGGYLPWWLLGVLCASMVVSKGPLECPREGAEELQCPG